MTTSWPFQIAPRLAPFPRDEALLAHAETALERLGHCSPQDLQQVLRETYPHATVQAQSEIARLGPEPVWYVFRDGHVGPALSADAWRDEKLPTFVIGDDGTYLDANDSASDLLGLPLEQIRGARVGSFTRHEPTDDAGMRSFAVLARTGVLESTAVVARPGDDDGLLVDYRITKQAGGGYRMVMRPRSATL